jgi:hypothetical protein
VGFTREWFTRVKETLGLSLSRCIYDPEDQQRLIQDAIDEFFATNANKEPAHWDRDRGYVDPDRPNTFVVLRHAGDDFATRLSLIAPLIKEKSFADEREWRLVAPTVSAHELDHRPGRSMLIPYCNIPIGDDDKFDSIREIIVGPTPHPDLSAASVRSLAVAAGLDNPDNILETFTQGELLRTPSMRTSPITSKRKLGYRAARYYHPANQPKGGGEVAWIS